MMVPQNCVWMKFLTWSTQNVDFKYRHSLRGTSYVLVLVSLNDLHSFSHSGILCLKLTIVIFHLGLMCLKNTANRPVHIICSQPQMQWFIRGAASFPLQSPNHCCFVFLWCCTQQPLWKSSIVPALCFGPLFHHLSWSNLCCLAILFTNDVFESFELWVCVCVLYYPLKVILASGYYAAFRVTLVAKALEGLYDGAIHITTDYEVGILSDFLFSFKQ